MPPVRRRGMAQTSFYNESDSDSDCARGFYDRSKKKQAKKKPKRKPRSSISSVDSNVTENAEIPGPPAAQIAYMENLLRTLILPSDFFTKMNGWSIMQCKVQLARAVSSGTRSKKALSAAKKREYWQVSFLTSWALTLLAVGLCVGVAVAVLILCPWDDFLKGWWKVILASWSCCDWSPLVPEPS